MKWQDMTYMQQHATLAAMQEFGGGFVKALATAWLRADASNGLRLANAFPFYLEEYGPGSMYYQQAKAETEPSGMYPGSKMSDLCTACGESWGEHIGIMCPNGGTTFVLKEH